MCSDGDPLEQVTAALDTLVEAPPAALADGEAVVALSRQLARLEAVVARATAAFEGSRRWEADGAKSASAWVAASCSVPTEAARLRVRLGRTVRELPEAGRAWLAGDTDEAELVGHAKVLHPRAFARVVAYWRQCADADGIEDEAERLTAERRVHLSSSFEGRWFLDGVLDPVGGEVLATALSSIDDELFRADWAEARARSGDAAGTGDLARTPAQRRADALVELARRATAVPEGARSRRPLFSVLLDVGTFTERVCELARSRLAVAPGALVPWLAEADVERVVFDGPDRVLAVGAARRFFAGADRRAIEVRDRECVHPLCDVPAEDCEVDHVVPFAEGGPTTAENGRLACGFHNRSRPGAARPPGRGEGEERGPP
jgi:Domain of unknown function (DUF222)